MTRNVVGFLFIVGALLAGCSSDDHFDASSEKKILKFQLQGQIGSTIFTSDTILVSVSDDVYLVGLSDLSASVIEVSNYAVVTPKVGEKQDFSKPVVYTVTAEDGSTKAYYVKVQRGGTSKVQLHNSSFDMWHDATYSNQKFKEIGENAQDETWSTGNKGVASAIAFGAKVTYPSVPYERAPGKFAAELVTQNMGPLAAGTFGGNKGVGAGNIFVGEFDASNIINAHPNFGLPYTETPTAFQVEYQYTPGKEMLDGKLNPVEGKDALDMFVILEKREEDIVKRIGVGWFRSGETQTDWKTKTVNIKYAQGTAPEGLEEYQTKVLKYGFDGDIKVTDPAQMPETAWGDVRKEKPTHIVVVFTSSYQGDYFIGAPGSKLLVDNFELIY